MVFANFEHFSLSALIFARYLLAAAFKATVEETISLLMNYLHSYNSSVLIIIEFGEEINVIIF